LHAASDLSAQDYSAFTQFFVNPAYINPSYTGIDGQPAVFLSYRKQWAGMVGSPSLAGVNFHTPLEKNLAVGVTAMNDVQGLVSTSIASFTGAYALKVATDKVVRFGLSVGGGWNRVDVEKLQFVTSGDNVLNNLSESTFQPMGNAGVSFHTPTFHFGISLPNIFQPVYVSPDAFTVSSIKPFESVIISASNRFYFSKDKNVFEPYVLYRLRGSLPSQFEVAGVVHLQNLVWMGASLRQDFGISALAGFKLNKLAILGYSYSIKSLGDNSIGRPSHEIQLGLLLGEHKKNTPQYSFVNAEKPKHVKTPEELARERKAREEAIAAEKRRKEEAAAAVAAAEKAKQEAAAEQKRREEQAVAREKFKADSIVLAHAAHDAEEAEKLRRLEEHKDDPDAHHGLHDTTHAHAERHEFVKRGNHTDEMDLNDYVIVGAFRGKENAVKFETGLEAMGFKDADYGFISARNIWYVYIYSGNDLTDVKVQRDKYRKMKMFKDAWLLTVHL
jgi:type IX secretion system PorP/SprF family membrane protein